VPDRLAWKQNGGKGGRSTKWIFNVSRNPSSDAIEAEINRRAN